MSMDNSFGYGSGALILGSPFVVASILYILAAFLSSRYQKEWPWYRIVLWGTGSLLALVAVAGPLAQRAHMDFTAHMLGHLLLGMLAPLLMALAAPVTLALRTLPVKHARRLSRVLRSRPVSFVSNPITASSLNIGGLWVLYTTNLYPMMHNSLLLYVLIHAHIFLAGYVFTISMIYIDPTPHPHSYIYRATIFVIALAGHGILSKYIYANPPNGVPLTEAQTGGMLMYYGGDAIDLILVFLLCLQWYKAARPRVATG